MGARCEPACGGVGPVEAGRLTGAHSSPFLNLGNVSHHTRHLLPENINSKFKDQNNSEKRKLFMRAVTHISTFYMFIHCLIVMLSITSAMQGLNILYLDLVIGIGCQIGAVLHLSIEC